MKIRILSSHIADGIPGEEELLDCPTIESIYAIRKLKVAVLLEGLNIEVDKPNSHGQVFIKDFDIWINEGDYYSLDAK